MNVLSVAALGSWTGLPADLAAELPASPRLPGSIGDPPRPTSWVALASDEYEGGVKAWLDGDAVVLVEGNDPVDVDGAPTRAPDLGEPDARFDTVLDRLVVENGELVYATRGLALRVNPGNGLLLGVCGFAPTTVEDYRTRLRPVRGMRERLRGAAP